jgi:hypothetical protein
MAAENDSPRCTSCQSENQKTFTAEIAIHFRGIEGLNKPIVWVFPTISVCLNCGVAQFMVSEKEVEVLRTGVPVEGTTVWLGNSYGEKAGGIRFLKLLGDCQF